MAVLQQLQAIKSGKHKRIKGCEVVRDGDFYIIDDERYELEDAVKRLDQPVKSGLDYSKSAFFECQPYSRTPIKYFKCSGKAEHHQILHEVVKRGNYLYYGAICNEDGKILAKPPYILDWDSVPDHPDEIKKKSEEVHRPYNPAKWDRGLSCPFCGVEVSSTPGRTLHVKAHHGDRLAEYHSLLTAPVKNLDDEDGDIVDRQLEITKSLCCPFCAAPMNSTSGRTLHVQGKHPERLAEYQKMVIDGEL